MARGVRSYTTAIPGEVTNPAIEVQDTEFSEAPEDLREQLLALQAENAKLRLAAEGTGSGFASPNSKYAHIDSRSATPEQLAEIRAEANAPVLLADGWLIP